MKKIALFFILLTGMSNIANAQWAQTSLDSTNVQALAIIGSKIFAGTWGDGIFLSLNNGDSWVAVDSGLTDLYIRSFAINNKYIFAGTSHGVYLSSDNGNSWTPTSLPITDVWSLTISGNNIFAGTATAGYAGVYLSTNNGSSWTAVNNGLPPNAGVSALAISDSNIFAGIGGGVYMSTDNGNSWDTVNNGIPAYTTVFSLAVGDSSIFAGTAAPSGGGNGGMYLSTNNGGSWTALTNFPNSIVYALAVNGSTIFAGTYSEGVYLSTNNGSSWDTINTGLTNFFIKSLAINNNYIFAGIEGAPGNGVWKRPLSDFTGIKVNNLNKSISIYPNPAKEKLTVDMQDWTDWNASSALLYTTLSVYDMQGQLLINQQIKQKRTDININDLAKGIYIVKVFNDNNTIISKFIKE